MRIRRFMQTVGFSTWRELVKEARARECSVQELIRIEIIPVWLKSRK